MCSSDLGDTIMLFTDGLYEVEGPDNIQFSQEMLLGVVRKHLQLNCGELFDQVLAEIKQFSGNHDFADDVCLVGMEVAEHFK